ncbi:hypothetical protein A9973_29715 [Achromobacter sp. UMC46]|nr:hypothetical protein [Achromobacter sp. UMC46]
MNRWSFELRQAHPRDKPPGAGWIIQKTLPIAMKKAVPFYGDGFCDQGLPVRRAAEVLILDL